MDKQAKARLMNNLNEYMDFIAIVYEAWTLFYLVDKEGKVIEDFTIPFDMFLQSYFEFMPGRK